MSSYLSLRLRELMARDSPTGKRWTSRQVAEEAEKIGHPMTTSYVQSLASGTRDNPTLGALNALAEVFGVSAATFIEPDPAGRNEVASALNTLTKAGADVVMARGGGALSAKALIAIADALREELQPDDTSN